MWAASSAVSSAHLTAVSMAYLTVAWTGVHSAGYLAPTRVAMKASHLAEMMAETRAVSMDTATAVWWGGSKAAWSGPQRAERSEHHSAEHWEQRSVGLREHQKAACLVPRLAERSAACLADRWALTKVGSTAASLVAPMAVLRAVSTGDSRAGCLGGQRAESLVARTADWTDEPRVASLAPLRAVHWAAQRAVMTATWLVVPLDVQWAVQMVHC